jgi:methionyl-tRNA synthetase
MPRLPIRYPLSLSSPVYYLPRSWTCAKCSIRYSSTAPAKATFPQPSSKPFYATSPIFYVNAAPHIGHLYSLVLVDVLTRWAALRGHDAKLSIGTDEHGLKVQKAAQAAGEDTQAFCDAGAEVFKDLADASDVKYDFFARTTDWRHKNAVKYAWERLEEAGWIYRDKHEGWYSISDETFYPETKVRLGMDPVTGKKRRESIETGSVVEWTSETNYRFRLSAFKDRLLEFYKENPQWITPAPFMAQVVQEIEESGLTDLSISRPSERVQWGIEVPGDPSQTVYVWLDALLNYAVQTGYPNENYMGNGWPADVHVIGKDILRFHCVYWPAFLMALELPLPKRILSHAHWTLGKQKMSKSRGNVVNPFYLLDSCGRDVVRWFMVYEGGLASDSDFDRERLVTSYKILTDGLGNMAARLTRHAGWDVEESVEHTWGKPYALEKLKANSKHKAMVADLLELRERVDTALDSLDSQKALKDILNVISKVILPFSWETC